MSSLFVVDNPKRWPVSIPGVEIISSRDYLTERRYSDMRAAKVFNLCRSYRYQTAGYYVSLLAEARGHRPIPSIATLQDLRSQSVVRALSEDLDERIQRMLKPLRSKTFELSIYFGQNMAQRYEALAKALFELFPAPLLRARLERSGKRWELRSLVVMGSNDIPEKHRPYVAEAAAAHEIVHADIAPGLVVGGVVNAVDFLGTELVAGDLETFFDLGTGDALGSEAGGQLEGLHGGVLGEQGIEPRQKPARRQASGCLEGEIMRPNSRQAAARARQGAPSPPGTAQ